jgi:hypothetical protein
MQMSRDEKAKPQVKPAKTGKQSQDEILEQELEDSFPASDPPQSTQPHPHVEGSDPFAEKAAGRPKRDKT